MTRLVTNLNIVAPPAGTVLLDPDMVAGRWLQAGEAKALVVADSIYKYYPDLKPGDKIKVKLPEKLVDEWTVVGVFRFMDMLGDTLAYADSGTIASLQNMDKRSSSFRLITDDAYRAKTKRDRPLPGNISERSRIIGQQYRYRLRAAGRFSQSDHHFGQLFTGHGATNGFCWAVLA